MTLAHHARRFERELRVLIVEDNPPDAEFMVRALQKAGLRVAHRVVDDEPAFRRALGEFCADVVLTDGKLPRFSGRRALRIAREHDPLLPVIMVTGALREDRIVRLIRLGLANHVLKDQLVRLAPALTEAVDRAQAQRAALRAREAMEASERRFRAVVEASGDALVIVNHAGKLQYCNPAAERMFGYTARELVDMKLERLVPEKLRARHAQAWRAVLGGAAVAVPFTAEVTALRKDGTEFPVELTVSSWEEEGKRYFSAQVRDIALRKEETRMRHLLSQVVEQTVTAVVITRVDGTIEYVNPAFERLTGYAAHEVLGKTPRILKSGRHPPEFYQRLWAQIVAGGVFTGDFVNRKKDGTEYQQEATIFPVFGEDGRVERFVGLGRDVTQQRLLEQQLRQTQRMEALGKLAAGIAHDFNNVLTGVLTNAQLLEFALPEGRSEEREYVEDVVAAARRGAALVKRLMSVSRGEGGSPRRMDIRPVVDEALKTIRRIVPENIEIRLDQAPAELPCVVDDNELVRALLNLATNARDAMPGGGSLAVRTLASEGHAVIEVRDNGVGMEPEVIERIFEPFFTTKEPGKGTGLGLAMVYGFAKRAGGAVTARSRPGIGTTMRIKLPLAAAAPADAEVPAPATESVPSAEQRRAHGTVLLAEDEDDIRRVAQKALERAGYRVLTASDGVEAMTLLARERGRVDLVLADLVMPRGGGGMLYRNTREWPDRPRFLFMSGHTSQALDVDRELLSEVPLLPKPWSIPDLEAAVARAMEGVTS